MSEASSGEEATLFPKTAGERLREAREAQGLSLAEIAARTRIPMRQLEAIETSNYTALPSITYSVGFAKAYARAVGADEVEIGRAVRNQNGQMPRAPEYQAYEMPDPRRTPPSGLVIAGLVIALLLIVGVGLWYGTSWFRGEDAGAPAVAVEQAAAPPVAAAAPAPVPANAPQVTLTATDTVWMRIYDATGKTLYQDTLQPGARYDVPADANGPMINVGRPDKLQVTLNGSIVPALGKGARPIKDVGISAAALGARDSAAAAGPLPRETPPPAATATATTRAARNVSQRPQPSTAPTAAALPPPAPAASAPAPDPTGAP